MTKKVTLYTNNGDISAMARKYLLENKILFEEINVAKAAETGKRTTIKASRLPLLVVRGSHGISTVSGFGEFQYASALNPRLSYDEFEKLKDKRAT